MCTDCESKSGTLLNYNNLIRIGLFHGSHFDLSSVNNENNCDGWNTFSRFDFRSVHVGSLSHVKMSAVGKADWKQIIYLTLLFPSALMGQKKKKTTWANVIVDIYCCMLDVMQSRAPAAFTGSQSPVWWGLSEWPRHHGTESPPGRLVMRRLFGTLWRTNEGDSFTHAEGIVWTQSILALNSVTSESTYLLLCVSVYALMRAWARRVNT